MKLLTSLLFTGLAIVAMSCSGSSDDSTSTYDYVWQPDALAEEDGLVDEDLLVDDADPLSEDLAEPVEEVAPEPEVTVPDYPEGACDQPELAECPTTGAAPEGASGETSFAVNNAVPLYCSGSSGPEWDFTVFLREFEGKRLFILGEVHGTNEIAPASAELLDWTVRYAGVNAIALEIGMDTTQAMNQYVQTGDSSDAAAYGAGLYTENMFRRMLPDRAHELVTEGYPIKAYGVDHPQRLAWVNEQLEGIAAGMTDLEAKKKLLENMPPPREEASYGMFGIETAYVNKAEAYSDHVVANLDTICVDFDAEECKHVEMLAYALWIGSVMASQDFMMGGMGGGNAQMFEMMMKREVLILYNFEQIMKNPAAIVYSHMGAAHAAKDGWNVAGQLDKHFEPAMGQIYTTTPAYGPGSAVFYGISTQNLPPEPKVVSDGLASMPHPNYFLSTNHAGLDCSENPFLDKPEMRLGGIYGSSWDAFFWFKKLTADNPGGWFNVPNVHFPSFSRSLTARLQLANQLLEEAQRRGYRP